MSIIKLPLRYGGSQGEKTPHTLFDSGAAFSCIHPDMVKDLGSAEKIRRPKLVSTSDALTLPESWLRHISGKVKAS